MLDGYAMQHGHHLNINVFNRETLLDTMEHPEEYPQLTIRVSGYAVNFIKLTHANNNWMSFHVHSTNKCRKIR